MCQPSPKILESEEKATTISVPPHFTMGPAFPAVKVLCETEREPSL